MKKNPLKSDPRVNLLLGILPLLFLLFNLARMCGMTEIPYMALMGLTGLLGGWLLVSEKRFRRGFFPWLVLIYSVFSLLNVLFIKNLTFKDLLSDLLLWGIAAVMAVYPYSFLQGAVFFYITAAVFGVYCLLGVAPYNVLTSSSNYISVVLVMAVSVYYMGLQRSGKKMNPLHLLPAGLMFAICLWAKGRSGILCSVVLLGLLLIYYLYTLAKKNRKVLYVLIPVLAAGVILMLIFKTDPIQIFMSLGKWGRRGSNNWARETIWNAYFEKASESPLYLLLGAPLQDIPTLVRMKLNLHSSFFQLHALSGLPSLLLVLFLTLRAALKQIRQKHFVLLIVLLAFVLRGLTDKFIFGQYAMPLFIGLLFYEDWRLFAEPEQREEAPLPEPVERATLPEPVEKAPLPEPEKGEEASPSER